MVAPGILQEVPTGRWYLHIFRWLLQARLMLFQNNVRNPRYPVRINSKASKTCNFKTHAYAPTGPSRLVPSTAEPSER